MKTKILSLLLLLAAGFALTACGDDDDVVIAAQHTIYVGNMHSEIEMDGREIDCGTITSTAVLDVDKNEKATITIKPFKVTVVPYNSMTIETREDIVATNLTVTRASGACKLKGRFEQMMPTVMNGREMSLLLKGEIEAEYAGSRLKYDIDIIQWGSMPFALEFDFDGTKQQ